MSERLFGKAGRAALMSAAVFGATAGEALAQSGVENEYPAPGPWSGIIEVNTSRGCHRVEVATGIGTNLDGSNRRLLSVVMGIEVHGRVVPIERIWETEALRSLVAEIENRVAGSEGPVYINRRLDDCPPPLVS